jgi:formate hydrogenlyase transcriptional activator
MTEPSAGNQTEQELARCRQQLAHADEQVRQLTDQVAALRGKLERQTGYLRDEINSELLYKKLIGNSASLRRVRQAVEQVAPIDSTVLILGETGTGKELIARAIHEQSPRRQQLLVKVNCAALPPGLVASELFGHEAGAFTGAGQRRVGRFELAHQGTLFLDEIAEISPDVQVLLLRVLQERAFERVGGNERIEANVRLVAATNRELTAEVAAGRFRADLFYRLNVFPIHLPPLRERADDIPLLMHHFRVQLNRRMHKQVADIDPDSLELARRYPWPGNVRELENLVERAMIVATGDTLTLDPAWLSNPALASSNLALPLAEMERRTILDTLHRCAGKIYGPDGAAAALGLKPTTLYGRMRKHRIRKQPGATRYE